MQIFGCSFEVRALFVYLSALEFLASVVIGLACYLYTPKDPSNEHIKSYIYMVIAIGLAINIFWFLTFAFTCSLRSCFHRLMAVIRLFFICSVWIFAIWVIWFVLVPEMKTSTQGVAIFCLGIVWLVAYAAFVYAHYRLLRSFFEGQGSLNDYIIGNEISSIPADEW